MAWIGAAISVAGGLLAGDGASSAADAQSAAADKATAVQEAARLQQRQDLSPWTSGGGLAQSELLKRLGLGGGTYTSSSSAPMLTADQIRAQLLPQYTKATAATQTPAPGNGADNLEQWMLQGGQTGSTVDEVGLNAAIQAQLQQQAQQQAQQAQAQATASSDPNYASLLAPAPAFKQFDAEALSKDLVYQNGLQFGLKTGVDGINQRASAGGSFGSGAALKALTRFGNDYATTKTGDAYNRNMTEQNNAYSRNVAEKNQIYDFLSGVSRQGQSAAAGVGAAGISTANGVAGNILASGNAQSAGIVGGANALSGGISDATNAYQWNQLLNKTKTPTTTGWGTGSTYGNQDYGSYL